MHSGFFHGGPPHLVGKLHANPHMRHEEYGFRTGMSYMDIVIRDLQLLTAVFVVAFLVHAVFRIVYSQFFSKQRVRKPRKSEDAARPLAGSIHDRLAAQELTGPELLDFAGENLESFTLSNLVFAIYRTGKLQVAASPEHDVLLKAVKPAVRKLKPRGAAHVLWGVARVKPASDVAEDLADELADVVAAKLGELRAVDVICSLWATAELSKGAPHRVNKLLLASDGVDLTDFSAAERVSVLATLAGAQVEAGAEWSGRTLVERALKAVVEDIRVLHANEQAKLVRAVCVLEQRELASETLVTRIFKAVTDSITDSSQPLQPRLEVLTAMPVASAAARNARHVIARHTMDAQFHGLTTKDLVVLSATMAVAGLPESGEFYLELAQALRPLSLSPSDQRTIKAAFAAVGVSNLLDL